MATNDASTAVTSGAPPPLKLSRMFPARRETVFRAWSSGEHIRRWFSPETYSVSDALVEMVVGGRFDVCMRSPGGVENWTRGRFVEVTPNGRLAIDMDVTDAAGAALFHVLTVVEFADADGGTRMSVTQTYDLINPSMAMAMVAGAREGWRTTLDKLGPLLAILQS